MKRTQLAMTVGSLIAAGLFYHGAAHATSGVWDYSQTNPVGPGNGSGATSATPWINPTAPGSSYAEWNIFNTIPTDSTPDIAGVGSITETSGGALLTGGGNIYSPFVATSFSATLSGAGSGLFDVWLRIATLGTVANTAATLNGVSAMRVETFSEETTITTPAGPSSSFEKEWYWKWTVEAAPTYTFGFAASGSSMSLDQVALYATAAPVPEPQSFVLLLAGLGMVGFIARRRLSA
jgi:hypothetical protein